MPENSRDKPDPFIVQRDGEGESSILEGVLERFVYSNEETSWSVAKIESPSRPSPVTATGNLLGVQPGESLRLRGRWTTDPRHGEQFKVESFITVAPATVKGIERYLGSGLVRGIGKVMAQRLTEQFGLDTLDVIENAPERLTEVAGIGSVRSARIRDAWTEQREIKEVMLFLQSNGVPTSHAIRIYKEYGARAIAIVRANPYRLALEVLGIGFKSADQIAGNMGIAPTSPHRAEAGILHLLDRFAEEGHLFYPIEDLLSAAIEMLQVDRAIVGRAIDTLALAGHVVIEERPDGTRPVYLKRLHDAETGIAGLIARLRAAPARPIDIDEERAVAWFERTAGIALAPRQIEALRAAIRSKILVITGGPGTGKTTLIRGIIRILEKKGQRILLCSPTGRAAKRMQETTGREASTIHRLLEFNPRTRAFERDRNRPLKADLVIVDEFSMVDAPLAHDLFKAIHPSCRIVMVGDVDQLPSVGPGSVLADLIRSERVPVIRLETIFRQAEMSRIIVNAHRVNRGQMPLSEEPPGGTDFFVVERAEPEAALAAVESLIVERIPRRFGLDPIAEIQVLTPMHRGLLGATNLNAELQRLLNPTGLSISRGNRVLRVGDKVLQTRNNYDLDVYNGDIGRIAQVDPAERRVWIRYDERTVAYDHADLDEVALAYACSIHKAQGSEYPCVVILLHTQHHVMLQRNLLYTAITRGRRLVVLVGNRRALAVAVGNSRSRERFSRLSERLRELAGAGLT